jgi:hypothetical protein
MQGPPATPLQNHVTRQRAWRLILLGKLDFAFRREWDYLAEYLPSATLAPGRVNNVRPANAPAWRRFS